MQKPTLSFATLIKTVIVASSPALAVLSILVLIGLLDLSHFFYAYAAVLGISTLLVYPLLTSVSTLTHYVVHLSQDKKIDAPDLSVLSTMGELSSALSQLHRSWERKKQQMESVITEREILVDTLPDILLMTNDDRIIVRTNRTARNIFGQNLAGKPLLEVVDSEVLDRTVASVIQHLRGKEVEFHINQPGPYEFRATIERFPIPSHGGISIIIALTDVTELKQVEQMRADFVANASHEIRTPLASIKGFIETLQGPAKDDEAARNEFLNVMADQADRMTRLISDLLSLSKIEMNAHTVPSGKVDMLQVIRKETLHFERMAKDKNMQIKLDLHDNLPQVRGEQSELVQVMHNLIGNALKYGAVETSVTVTARITSSIPQDPLMRDVRRAVCISVKDKGEGIPKEHLPRLTERFYRVDSARSRAVGGTGLGLAIVKHILNRHQGILAIDSVVGEGSVFSVYLPVYEG